jgi:hypothetical protein
VNAVAACAATVVLQRDPTKLNPIIVWGRRRL